MTQKERLKKLEEEIGQLKKQSENKLPQKKEKKGKIAPVFFALGTLPSIAILIMGAAAGMPTNGDMSAIERLGQGMTVGIYPFVAYLIALGLVFVYYAVQGRIGYE